MYSLGALYNQGLGVDLDYKIALDCFNQSAKLDYADAEEQIGILYLKGNGVELDVNTAIVYFTQAAEKGNTHAMYQLGYCYYNIEAVKNLNQSFNWHLKAAKLGNAESMAQVSWMYCFSQGCSYNTHEAHKWALKSAIYNQPQSFFVLGVIHFRYKEFLDLKLAEYYFLLAIEHKFTPTVLVYECLGKIYFDQKYYEKLLDIITKIINLDKKKAVEFLTTTLKIEAFMANYIVENTRNYRKTKTALSKLTVLNKFDINSSIKNTISEYVFIFNCRRTL
jgi:tetratricopeptide (TPR) repeat protein